MTIMTINVYTIVNGNVILLYESGQAVWMGYPSPNTITTRYSQVSSNYMYTINKDAQFTITKIPLYIVTCKFTKQGSFKF